jgi:predicted ATP-dependent protease
MVTQSLEPAPIPLEVTIILVGQQGLYYTLYELEEDFRDLFRVKADFGDVIQRTPDTEQQYAQFIAAYCHQYNLKHFHKAAVARLVEYGCWLTSDQQKLAADFGAIASLMREAVFFAQQNQHKVVKLEDVQQAIQERIYRNNELEELSQERISDGTVFIDVSGQVVGQINGLVVITVGDHSFGLPSRLTARVYLGREGIVHIDRETEMTGRLHDKGVKILEGYLGGLYAQEYPLAFSASITFEQSYAEVEGDSASSTELFVLLSALSGFPLRQDLAVTGSVNQHGHIQVIGGVTQKIEGFFTTCKNRGLTGQQGVIIPKSNVRDLMLNDEVVEAVKAGQFHVYAIQTVDEGIALLTGRDPLEVHQAVDKRLYDLARKIEDFGDSKEEGEDEVGEA